jgi:uncharacterized MAPEG superfamily protein
MLTEMSSFILALLSPTSSSIDPSVAAVAGMLGLVYVPFAIKLATAVAVQGLTKYDNRSPRTTEWESLVNPQLAGFLRRLTAAHDNSWEAFSSFGIAIALCKVQKVPESVIMPLATAFLNLRVLYTLAYASATNQVIAYVRTGLFFGGIGILLKLYALAGAKAVAL